MKTAELTGAALDCAVLIAAGFMPQAAASLVIVKCFNPSENWEQGGPIIEREKMAIMLCESVGDWLADLSGTDKVFTASGPTPLVAAMRCYVASKLGDEVDIWLR